MYSGFNLKINAERDCGPDSINFLDPGYIKTGETHLGDVSGKVNQELENMVLKGTDIPDGVAIQNDWFPEINADIFISHSHSDRDLANGIAGWINQKFGLRCFIDSNVWGHADSALTGSRSPAGPRRLGTATRIMRIAVPKAFCVLREHLPAKIPKRQSTPF